MSTKSLKRSSSKASEASSTKVVADKKRGEKKGKKAEKVFEEEVVGSEPEEEEDFSDAESEHEESSEVAEQEEKEEDGVNPKLAWMTAEEREEKKRAQKEEQKRVRLERKLSNPGYTLIQQHRPDWDLARRLDTPKEERQAALKRLFTAFTGKFKELILKHEGSRVVQTCVKHGSLSERNQIATELSGSFLEISKNKYGKFIVSKLLLYCPGQREAIMNEFSGHLAKAMRHKESQHVVEAIFADYANGQRKQRMIQEFFGPEFALFHKDQAMTLAEVVKDDADKRAKVAQCLEEHLAALLQKGSLGLTLVHRLMLEYLSAAELGKAQAWISGISDFLPEIVHTLDGARAVAKCIALAPSKDRKAIVKSFKPFIEKICKDDRGFQAILAVLALVDDTVLVGKTLLGEVKNSLAALLKDRHGRKVAGYLVCGPNSRLLPPQTMKLLGEVREMAATTSKKDDAIRLQELRSQILPDIFNSLSDLDASAYLKDMESAVFLSEVLAALPADDQSRLFQQYFEAIGTEASFVLGPKCEFIKKVIKGCSEQTIQPVLCLILSDLPAYASGEGGFMLMHMLRFETIRSQMSEMRSKLKKVGGPGIAALLRRLEEPTASALVVDVPVASKAKKGKKN